ncbi:ATP-binding cassette domain-containing protein [Streptomyces sp. NPDC006529]|uniref:ABC transporter ATP-binding protein n=1 Tax=Streptomyces sp. NPDC006529 TaxID=3157177 RepID=UPI0033B99671
MISFENVSVKYDDAPRSVLRDVNLTIGEGELCLVVGRTGAGKSTLLGAVNGLVPHFTGGTLYGRVTVGGRDTAEHPPRELADLVGVVGQDPLDGFVTDTVGEELAYAVEQLGVDPAVRRKRIEETLELLDLTELRHRPLHELSGGQQQRVALGSVLTAHPRVLVLDEPTSALDPASAGEVLAAVTRLVRDLGVTVLLSEHRLERVAQYADRVIHLPGDGTVVCGPPAEVFRTSTVAPPVVELGRLAGWDPLPLSAQAARRVAAPLRARLAGRTPAPVRPARTADPAAGAGGTEALRARAVTVTHMGLPAVREVDLVLRAGEVTALMGPSGSGKTSLLCALHGSGPRRSGTVTVRGAGGAPGIDPGALPAAEARRLVGMVPQTPTDLLSWGTVRQELAQGDAEGAGSGAGPARELLDRLAPGIDDAMHPRDLSEGRKLALVLAVRLTAAPGVVLLDEPTRGLDRRAKTALIRILDDLAAAGRAVLIATHDVEFAVRAADRVVMMAEGEAVAEGAAAEILAASTVFTSQVAEILPSVGCLTVAQVAGLLNGS